MSILVVYWTGTGNTEIMAEKILEGIKKTGVEVDYKTIDQVLPSEIENYDKVAFGCPSMGIEQLEEDEFEPWFMEVEPLLGNKKIALFGSYGWGEGEWMDYWEERVQALDVQLFERGLKINSTPSSKEQADCVAYGERFANF